MGWTIRWMGIGGEAVLLKKEPMEHRRLCLATIALSVCLTLTTGCETPPTEIPDLLSRVPGQPLSQLVGTKYSDPPSTEIIARYGNPETLTGTSGSSWVGYFPKGDFTLTTTRPAGTIIRVQRGREPQ